MKTLNLSLAIAMIYLFLTACRIEPAEPQPTVTPIPSPIITQIPKPSPLPTITPAPSVVPTPTALPTPSPVPSPTAQPTPTPQPTPNPQYALLWEAKRPESKAWTKHVYRVIKDEVATTYLPGSSDVTDFCPNYNTLNNDERTQFWGLLISAITKYESGFDPTSRMQESTMGTDPVTGEPVYSEGLLQLSYQDTQWARYCEFDWEKDKNLARNDPKKTILDPIKNLSCGMKILAGQVRKRSVIAAPQKYAYWSVLIPGGKYSKLPKIIELTKKAPGCLSNP